VFGRFIQNVLHPRLDALLLVLLVDVSGQGHNCALWHRRVLFQHLLLVLNYLRGRLEAVHYRHLEVHEDELVILTVAILRAESQPTRLPIFQILVSNSQLRGALTLHVLRRLANRIHSSSGESVSHDVPSLEHFEGNLSVAGQIWVKAIVFPD